MKHNAKLRPYYFSVNVLVLTVVFHRQTLKNRQFQAKLLVFWNLLAKYNHDGTSVFFQWFFKNDPHFNAVESFIKDSNLQKKGNMNPYYYQQCISILSQYKVDSDDYGRSMSLLEPYFLNVKKYFDLLHHNSN